MSHAIQARKDALKMVSNELKLMPDEDLARVAKLVKAELKSRTALDSLTAELDEAPQ
jgi:hypothetical protein